MSVYVETDCTIEFNGQTFESGGAAYDGSRIVAYLGESGVLTNWRGDAIGRYVITSTWQTPRSYVSTTMSQVSACVEGVWYTGRSAGVGMAYVGKRKAQQCA